MTNDSSLKHSLIEDTVLVGRSLGENSDGSPEVLIYKNEKSGEIFTEPERYYRYIYPREPKRKVIT